MNKFAKLLSFIIVLSMVVTHIVVFPVEVNATAVGQYIIGDGSGGGGGGSNGAVDGKGGAGGNGGNGGGGDDTITGTEGSDVIFGDGSGGGAGGRGISWDTFVTRGGLGGGGNDDINGNDGNDVIFGDGFDGDSFIYSLENNIDSWNGRKGGLGGGGGGATGGYFNAQATAGIGGIGAGGGGGGTVDGLGAGTIVSEIGSVGHNGGHNNGGNGGNSASTKDEITGGSGGSGSNFSGGGGAGFGGAAGGDGGTLGAPGDDGDTNEHRYNDSTEAIRKHFSESNLRTILIDYPEYGAGNDIINGGSGSNELFGLGGNDTFIVNSADNATRNRIWDFKSGDIIQLKTENSFVSTEAMRSILSEAATIDLDGDGQNDDTRLVFSGCNIDLVNVSPTNLLSGENGIYLTNTAPVLSIADDSLLFSIPSQTNSIQIDPSGKLIDADGDNHWHHGKLSVQITSDATTSDVFSILDNNNTSPNITTVQGNTILSNANKVIGRFSLTNGGVNGSTQLEISFFSTATNEIVQEVMRSIRFSTSEKGTGTRTISIRATDLAGAYSEDSRTIIVIDVQDYDISFNSNGGSAISPIKADYNTLITAPTSPSKTGYSFAGWYRDVGLATAWNFTVDRVPSSDLVLHAKWTINEYTVTFKNYDGSVIETQVVTHGSSATVPATPIRTGYTFAAWDGSLSNITSNTEVTATYTANTNTAYTVEHYQQGLNGTYVKTATDNLTGTTGIAVTAAVKTYTGFSENVNHTSRVASGTISADGSTVLKLYYDRNKCTVSFINHNSEVLSTEDVLYGGKATAPTNPTRAFHTFAGWFTDNETFSKEWSFTDNQVTGNINLYAKWIRIPQSINRVNVDPETTITVNGLNDKVRLPEADNANTADIVVFVKAEPTKVPEIIKDKAAAEMSKKGLTMLNVFDIGLYKRITTYEGATSESEISNNDITGKITVQIPLTEEQAKKDNLAIAYVDDAGNVTIIPGKIVAVGSAKYFEFETDHFSMYSLVEIAEVSIPKTGEKPYSAIGLALLLLAAAVYAGKRRFRQENN